MADGALDAGLQLLNDGSSSLKAKTRALRYFRTAAAAGLPAGRALLARMLLNGWAVSSDPEAAFDLVRDATDPWGLYVLGTCLTRSAVVDRKLGFEVRFGCFFLD